jgi:pyrroline-5-carboxylate reductase
LNLKSQNGRLTSQDKLLVDSFLSATGVNIGEVKDSSMNAVMAISGSSIAYMYIMIDAIADGGVKQGLTRQMALRLGMQTMQSASQLMIDQFGIKHPIQLKDEVCSPGGSTIHGLHELERNGFRNSIICAIEGVVNRNKQF